ncbi:MAG: hypothetical protein E6J74_17755 [Deltaproteobacteria bacterium]|nr:MAG: hypothetical protein E6J74_17755 [Deltaproteobacteria bacterium]
MLQHCQGQRCQATRIIRGHQGLISAHTQGTIEAEISNLGRHLIAVRWDNGLHMYVFPDEIEVDETIEEWNDDTW